MSTCHHQSGFAIALLLWMIAGMSLMVTAVIHFARADTSMVELRVLEAKAEALSRGVALLTLRDSAAAREDASDERIVDEEAEREGKKIGDGLFTRQYQFGDGWDVTATLWPSGGLVSINNESPDVLTRLFAELGRVDEAKASAMVEGVLTYRSEFPGFRYREELLAVADSSRHIYDRVKDFVHPFRTGSLDRASAPSALKAVFEKDSNGESVGSSGEESAGSKAAVLDGLMTFDLIAEQKRLMASPDTEISAIDLELTAPSGRSVWRRVWVSLALVDDPIIRIEHISSAAGSAL